jgi:cell wall-associated NlpC family hydrolase
VSLWRGASYLALVLLAPGCMSRAPSISPEGRATEAHQATPLRSADRDLIAVTALAQVGKPYRYGGNGPDAFDCSGLVRHAYLVAGVKVPRSTSALFREGEAIRLDDARPGDLVFYRFDDRREGPSHVVVYLGDGEGVHAPSSGGAIRAVRLDMPYFSQRYLGTRRLLR